MTWIFPAVLCAIFFGGQGVFVRYLHLKKISGTPVILFSYFLFSLPILFIPAAEAGFQPILKGFWPVSFLVAAGNVAGFYAYINALKFSEASLVLPVLATSPLFVIPAGILILGETPAPGALGAILIIVAGCYILTCGKNLLEPFKKIKEERGIRWAFFTVLVWAVVANLDKIALAKSSVKIYPFLVSLEITILAMPVFFKGLQTITKRNIKFLIGCGFFNAGVFLTHIAALALTKVSYLISVKRSGVLIGILGGIIFFREKEPARRVLAAVIILAGNILLYLNS